MVKLKDRIQKLKLDTLDNSDEKWSMITFNYLSEFKMTMNELLNEPIPSVMINIDFIIDKYKKKKRGK